MSENSELSGLIRRAITHARQERGLPSDKALADALGIDPVTLWRWKEGDVGRAAAILVPLIAAAERATTESQPIAIAA